MRARKIATARNGMRCIVAMNERAQEWRLGKGAGFQLRWFA